MGGPSDNFGPQDTTFCLDLLDPQLFVPPPNPSPTSADMACALGVIHTVLFACNFPPGVFEAVRDVISNLDFTVADPTMQDM